jgi:hypothetical protein
LLPAEWLTGLDATEICETLPWEGDAGYLAWDDEFSGPRPAVAIAHTWAGRSEFECDKARRLAGAGGFSGGDLRRVRARSSRG